MHVHSRFPDASRSDYLVLQQFAARFLPGLISALHRSSNAAERPAGVYRGVPFADAQFNTTLSADRNGIINDQPCHWISEQFEKRPLFLRMEVSDGTVVGLPVGECGELHSRGLLRAYDSLIQRSSSYRSDLPRLVGDYLSEEPAFDEVFQRSTFWGNKFRASTGGLARAVDYTLMDGLFSTVQAVAFLTSHRLAEVDHVDGNDGQLLQLVSRSDLPNRLAGMLPFGVMGPALRSGYLPRHPPVRLVAEGEIVMNGSMSRWLDSARRAWRQNAASVREFEPGRSTAGFPCVAARFDRRRVRGEDAPSDPSPIGQIAAIIGEQVAAHRQHGIDRSLLPVSNH